MSWAAERHALRAPRTLQLCPAGRLEGGRRRSGGRRRRAGRPAGIAALGGHAAAACLGGACRGTTLAGLLAWAPPPACFDASCQAAKDTAFILAVAGPMLLAGLAAFLLMARPPPDVSGSLFEDESTGETAGLPTACCQAALHSLSVRCFWPLGSGAWRRQPCSGAPDVQAFFSRRQRACGRHGTARGSWHSALSHTRPGRWRRARRGSACASGWALLGPRRCSL